MSGLLAVMRCVAVVLATWSLVAVIVAVPVAALFRLQARTERIWHDLERRRLWREASGLE